MDNNPIESYIAQFSPEVQKRLKKMRAIVRDLCPEATEAFSYGLIGYKHNGKPLVYFGGFKHHVGLYATPNGHQAFAKEFAPYKQGKGSVQLPLNEPLPEELIRRVVSYRKEATS